MSFYSSPDFSPIMFGFGMNLGNLFDGGEGGGGLECGEGNHTVV